MLLRARHYSTDALCDLIVDHGVIESITSVSPGRQPDLEADIVAPAYFDLQINGGMGINFTSDHLVSNDIETVIRVCARHGIGAFCPTVITSSCETITASMKALAQACDQNLAFRQAMPCFHLEGPFISAGDGPRGAHPREHVQKADWESFQRWQEAADGRIKLLTLAPESPGALPLIEKLVRNGVVVALGHTAGPPALIREAIAAGARLSTHLGNGCARMLPRHENVLWEQLSADTLIASIIPDGHHLPWNLAQCILRCKTLKRLIITCDASPLAGLVPGKYPSWGQDVDILPEGKIVLTQQGVLAGSWDFTAACVEKSMVHLGLSYAEVHALASDHPRQLLGLQLPALEAGQPADLVLLKRDGEGRLRHSHSLIRGEMIAN